jgi:AcrR family transcriptional regulator
VAKTLGAVGTVEQDEPDADWRVSERAELSPILAHTLAAFEEHGYHGTSVRDIAGRVGVTVPALYYHYQNKQAMLCALLMGSMASLLSRCRSAIAEAAGDPAAELSALVECLVRFMAYRGSKGLLDSEIRSLQPDNRAKYIALRDELDTATHRIIADGVAAGLFRTEFPIEAGRGLLTMCHAVARWYRLDGGLSPEELAERYVALGLGMVGYQPAGQQPISQQPAGHQPRKRQARTR